jgi:hypothetical protein
MMNNKHSHDRFHSGKTNAWLVAILSAEDGPRLHMQRIPLGLLTNTIIVLWQILQMTVNRAQKEHNGKCVILSRLRKMSA